MSETIEQLKMKQVILLIVALFTQAQGKFCSNVASGGCQCTIAKTGQVVDVSFLTERLNAVIRVAGTTVTIEYQPCGTVVCGYVGMGKICLIDSQIGPEILADSNDEDFGYDSEKAQYFIYYQHQSSFVKIWLKCSESATMKPTLSCEMCLSKTSLQLQVASARICKLKPPSNSSLKNGGLSIGSILLITVFVLLVVYLIGGFIYNAKFRSLGMSLKAIPNLRTWRNLKDLTKEGFIISKNKIASKISRSEGYETID